MSWLSAVRNITRSVSLMVPPMIRVVKVFSQNGIPCALNPRPRRCTRIWCNEVINENCRGTGIIQYNQRRWASSNSLTSCKAEIKKVCVTSTDDIKLDPCFPQPRVVIVGAGMAGLAAAARLVSCNFENFIILEGNPRLGGRIHSCWLGTGVAEMGAQWIHGGSIANPVFTLAVREGLLKSPLPLKRCENEIVSCLTSDGRAIEQYICRQAYKIFKRIQYKAYALFGDITGTEDEKLLKKYVGKRPLSLFEFYKKMIDKELNKIPYEIKDEVERVIYGLTNSLRCRWGEDLNLISAEKFGSYIEIPGYAARVPKGFAGVLTPLIQNVNPDKFKFCKVVKTIHWSRRSPRAILKCCDGSSFDADFVLCTVSLGVLKKYHQGMFCPELPKKKVVAIDRIGFGHINKLFFMYHNQFWVKGEGKIRLAWQRKELPTRDSAEWERAMSTIEEVPDSEGLLMCMVAGKEARCVETLPETEVAIAFTQILRDFTGDPTIPYPEAMFRSAWSCDPLFMGASSFVGIDTTIEHQCDLAEPLTTPCDTCFPVLMFAGEATIPGYFSTVQGAMLSGIREADRIVGMTKRFRQYDNLVP